MEPKNEIAQYLQSHHIPYEVFRHAPFFTVAETLGAYEKMGIPENKTLFLRDEKKRHYFLLVMPGEKRADLKALATLFQQKRLSFASEKDLNIFLKTYPGAVSPLGLIFDREAKIKVYLDTALLAAPFIGFHPNDNTETWKFAMPHFQNFLKTLPHTIHHLTL